MFSILQKPQDTVNAEDLETLQNEIERRLVDVVTQKWELERELIALNSSSPDLSSAAPTPTILPPSSSPPTGKRGNNAQKSNHSDLTENANDGFKAVSVNSGNNGAGESASGTNSTEDSVSSEGSLVSNLTGSTIITANLPDLGSQIQTGNSSTSNKRSHKASNDRPSKRFRQSSSHSQTSTTSHTKRPPHSKHRSKIVPSKFKNSSEESRPNKKQIYRNEAPDKLWPFVEQFCSTPTEEQIQELNEMIRAIDTDKDYFKVPTLGKRDVSVKDSPAKLDNGGKNQKRSKTRSGEDETGLGALTQRLVSSLIEETDVYADDSPKSGETQLVKKKNPKNKDGKAIDISNAKTLERTIKQELVEHKILTQQDDIPYSSEDDEILRELVACQHELLSVQSNNKESMRILLKRAKKHLELENERDKLREANADVISAYHRLLQAKQRKRNPTKKEKDAAWKALKIQEAIFKRCDDLYMANLNRNNG